MTLNLRNLRLVFHTYCILEHLVFSTGLMRFVLIQDNGEKFTNLLTAIGAYAEGFSLDPVIRRAFYLWKKLEKT